MRILLTKGTPSAPKSQSRFTHIHKSPGKSCLCSPEPARVAGRKTRPTRTKMEEEERHFWRGKKMVAKNKQGKKIHPRPKKKKTLFAKAHIRKHVSTFRSSGFGKILIKKEDCLH